MASEIDNSGRSDVERSGLSRRQMIRASAVAGAAAWTAPMIIDSLSSPAAAGSQCFKYYVKLLVRYSSGKDYSQMGQCYCADPACNSGCPSGASCASGAATGYIHLCSGSGFCGAPATSPGITLTPIGGTPGSYDTDPPTSVTVTLNNANCYFSKDRSRTNFDGIGNHNWPTAACAAATISANGKTATYDNTGKDLDFAYAEFCCGFNTTSTTSANNPK
jgi:hypothetical protein